MKLLYEDIDITSKVSINKAEFIDNAGGVSDSINLIFNDPKGIWSTWKPAKNDKIEISESGLSSGVMYSDEIEQNSGTFIIRARSIPQNAKEANTKSWESVRFLEFASEIASKYGFTLETYNIENYLYNRVDQFETTDFSFLAFRCLLEGYVLKINNKKVIIYNESLIEGNSEVKTISTYDFDGDYKFKSTSNEIYSSCEVNYEKIKGRYKAPDAQGSTLKYYDIYISSQSEGERFAKNLLRAKNKYENIGSFKLKLDTDLMGGSNINISDVGLADGKYFCEQIKHNFIDFGKTAAKVRKVLEGY